MRLLNERARIGIEIGHAKAAAGLRVYDPGREDEVLRRVADANTGPVADDELLALYRQIIALTRRLEGPRDDTAAGLNGPALSSSPSGRPGASGSSVGPSGVTRRPPIGMSR